MKASDFQLQKTKTPVRGDENAKLLKLIPQKCYAVLGQQSDLNPILRAIGDSKVVMIGEASHGTHEFYKARADITKRLIQEKKISFVGVEGDWPDVYRINR